MVPLILCCFSTLALRVLNVTEATMQLTSRQKLILTLIIHEHIHSAQPVGSKTLVAKYDLSMSSATVRNEMAFLTDVGLLRQPNTSAGRVPTERVTGSSSGTSSTRPGCRPTPAAPSSTSSTNPVRMWNSGSNWRRPYWRTNPRQPRWSPPPTQTRRFLTP